MWKAFSILTEHLNVIEYHGRAVRADAVVRPANVSARVCLTHRVDKQVAEQEVRVVVRTQVLPVLCPRDLGSWDATSHALQHQPLAFSHHDRAGRWRVNDPSRF